MATRRWKPSWWKDETHSSGWERVKEALRRDWQQTRHDLHAGGHELNQGLRDTVRQIAGRQPLPPIDRPNPPKVIGSFDEAELPMEYGYGAKQEFGEDRFSLVEPELRRAWESRQGPAPRWEDVRDYVRRGFEHREGRPSQQG